MNCPVHTISTRRDALDDARKVLADAYEDIADIRLIPALGSLDGEIRGLDFALRLIGPAALAGDGQIAAKINATHSSEIVLASKEEREEAARPAVEAPPLHVEKEPLTPPAADAVAGPKTSNDDLALDAEPAPSPPIDKPRTQKEKVLAAYEEGHRTGADIAKATGIGRGSVDAVLSVLRKEGKLSTPCAVSVVGSVEVAAKPRVPF